MGEITIGPVCAADVWELAARIRKADREEVMASSGLRPLQAVIASLEASSESCAARAGGDLIGIFGVAPIDDAVLGNRRGVVWLLTTEAIERHKKAFLRACRGVIRDLFLRWDELVNAIDVRHEKSIRWAERMGFRLEAPEAWGHEGRPFRLFRVTEEDLPCANP